MKRALTILLALVLMMAMAVPAMAESMPYSITVKNTNTNITIKGNTYSAYKVFDATYSGDNVSYTVSNEFKNFTYTVGENSYSGETLISYLGMLSDNAEALDAFAKAALKYATANSISAAGTATAADETATISLSAPGYYLVTGTATAPKNQTVTAACSLTTVKPQVEIDVKVDAPSVDKKIVEGEKKVDANTASIGDAVNYEITSKVPNMKGYTKYYFVMHDTLSKGLTFNEDMTITVGSKTLTKDTDYTLTVTKNEDGTTSLKIVFKNFIQYTNGDAITVKYSATLNQDADLTQTGNTNEVKLVYSNNPNQEGTGVDEPNPNDPVGETPKSVTKTYATGLKLTKQDGEGNKLTGAKFEIKGEGMKVVLVNKEMYKPSEKGTYYMLKDGTFTTTAPSGNVNWNDDKYDSTTTKYEKVTVVTKETEPAQINATGYVAGNGVLTFEGLGKGTYTITELVAPNGYNLLKDEITITINANATLNGCTWTVKKGENALAVDGNLYAFTVVNQAGTELPSTGGIGTTVFYVVGGLLVAVAVVLLVTKKKMSVNK